MAAAFQRQPSTFGRLACVIRNGRPRCMMLPRQSSTLADIRQEMLSRPAQFHLDWPTPIPARLLEETLLDFLPMEHKTRVGEYGSNWSEPPGFHLVYFPTNNKLSSLLPDGTDTLHSPGPPFTRRMWAGGKILWELPRILRGDHYICRESIADVQIKGPERKEKIFVTISRWIGRKQKPDDIYVTKDFGSVAIKEDRILVFMRESARGNAPGQSSPVKVLRPAEEPDYSLVMTPTAQLLFRFSALTWNAHAIHLDKEYCREREGHRNLLVHGPLSLVLMLRVLEDHLANTTTVKLDESGMGRRHIGQVEYRNLAPLYAEELLKICVKRKGEDSWSIWIEGRDGGYAVKGSVQTHGSERDERFVFRHPEVGE